MTRSLRDTGFATALFRCPGRFFAGGSVLGGASVIFVWCRTTFRGVTFAITAQNGVYRTTKLYAPGLNFGLARAHNTENSRFCIVKNINFQFFAQGIVVGTRLPNGIVQILSLKFLKAFHMLTS